MKNKIYVGLVTMAITCSAVVACVNIPEKEPVKPMPNPFYKTSYNPLDGQDGRNATGFEDGENGQNGGNSPTNPGNGGRGGDSLYGNGGNGGNGGDAV